MMSFLQTGRALYVLAAICLAGVFSRLMAGSFYKRLIKESTNMALTKNKCLRNLKQNAEDTYRINQGMSNTRVYLERQMYSLRTAGMTARGLDNLSGQLTLLCFLAGGGAAFLSYWYRSDNYYIVLSEHKKCRPNTDGTRNTDRITCQPFRTADLQYRSLFCMQTDKRSVLAL